MKFQSRRKRVQEGRDQAAEAGGQAPEDPERSAAQHQAGRRFPIFVKIPNFY